MRSFEDDLKGYDNLYRDRIVSFLEHKFNGRAYKVDMQEHFYGYVLEKLGIDYVVIVKNGMEGKSQSQYNSHNQNQMHYPPLHSLSTSPSSPHELFTKIITVQVKVRDPRYYMQDICIEVLHESEDSTMKSLGNIFDLRAHYMLYIWRGNERGLLLNVDKLREFFSRNKSKYDLVQTRGTYSYSRRWITYNMIIPLKDITCYGIVDI